MSADSSINLRITAENEAEKAFREVEMQTKQMVKGVRDVGEQSKVSAELVGSLAAELGGGEFAAFAGTAAMMTDRIKNFSFALEGGTKAAVAFKVAAAGVAGVLGFELGRQIGEAVYGVERLNNALQSSAEKMKAMRDPIADMLQTAETPDDAGRIIADIDTRAAAAGVALQSARDKLTELRQDSGRDWDWGFTAELEAAEIAAQRAEIRYRQLNGLREQAVSLQAELVRKINEQAEKEAEIERKRVADATSKYARDQVAAIAKEEAEREAKRQAALKRRMQEEERVLAVQNATLESMQMQALALSEGAAVAERMRLESEGFDSNTAAFIAGLNEQLRELQNSRSSLAPGLTAQNQRLITGKGAEFRKTAADIENERQTKIQTESKKILSEIKTELQNIRPVEIYVLGE